MIPRGRRAGSRGAAEHEAAEQRDAADEGRVEASGSIGVGKIIVSEDKVVRPSQLIASVRRTPSGAEHRRGAQHKRGDHDQP